MKKELSHALGLGPVEDAIPHADGSQVVTQQVVDLYVAVAVIVWYSCDLDTSATGQEGVEPQTVNHRRVISPHALAYPTYLHDPLAATGRDDARYGALRFY